MQISTFKDDKSSVFETDTAVAKILKNDTDFYTGKICLGCVNYTRAWVFSHLYSLV